MSDFGVIVDVRFLAGTSKKLIFEYRDSNGAGIAIPLTASLEVKVRATQTSVPVLLDLSSYVTFLDTETIVGSDPTPVRARVEIDIPPDATTEYERIGLCAKWDAILVFSTTDKRPFVSPKSSFDLEARISAP